MKHAYLIIAHNEFEVLKRLVGALDDSRNDIFVHIDRKVEQLPEINVRNSRLFVLDNRVDVRWGHVSQIESEMRLFETAYSKGSYERYHIISGVHLPIKSNDYIHSFFSQYEGRELLHMWPFDDYEANVKIRTKHIFIRWYKSPNDCLRKFSQLFWNINYKFRSQFDIKSYRNIKFYKSDNWVSLTEKTVGYLVNNKDEILERYKYSFCGDEFFVATELLNNKEIFTVVDTDKLLFVDFIVGAPRNLTSDDEGALASSPCLFARKFDSKDIDFIDRVLNNRK